MRDASAAAVAALREFFTGPVIRAIAGIRDAGEVILAKVVNLDGGDHLDTEGDADMCVHYQDALSGMPGIARLYVPGNLLFGAPIDGDSAMVLRPRDQHGPGVNYILHGDLGTADRVPSWIRTKVGLWFKDRVMRVESGQEHVEVVAGAGKKIALGASADDGALQPAPLGTDLNTYLGTMRDKINGTEDRLNDLIAQYNLHVHPITTAPGTSGPADLTEGGIAPTHVGDPPALSTIVQIKP